MEITGTLLHLLAPQTGNGKNGPWKKQDFVIETGDQYPKKICISTWGDKIDLSKFSMGQSVKVNFDLESREFNGKWYTDVKAFGMQPANQSEKSRGGAEPGIATIDVNDDLPF
ncbi:MAG: DUF3127 domain-containing protein [Chitinophagaceae bacterium]